MPVSNLPLSAVSNLLSGPRFTETELLELNKVIIARIKILRRLTAAQIGASLSIGGQCNLVRTQGSLHGPGHEDQPKEREGQGRPGHLDCANEYASASLKEKIS